MNCCGRDCSSKHHSSSVGTKANRVWGRYRKATIGRRKYESQKELKDKIDLTGWAEWSQNEQKEAWELITEYASIFAVSNMDLGRTSLVKHSIGLTGKTLFKEHYWQIPLSMYLEVREHLKEMLEFGIIWPSHSQWASPDVLVCKKDDKLWFCIDLKTLNACTIKDSYSLASTEDTLDSLNVAVWFTVLDLKLGYWQVGMDKASKPLMAFMVGLLNVIVCLLDWWMPQLHFSGSWRHIWVTFSATGVSFISTT